MREDCCGDCHPFDHGNKYGIQCGKHVRLCRWPTLLITAVMVRLAAQDKDGAAGTCTRGTGSGRHVGQWYRNSGVDLSSGRTTAVPQNQSVDSGDCAGDWKSLGRGTEGSTGDRHQWTSLSIR